MCFILLQTLPLPANWSRTLRESCFGWATIIRFYEYKVVVFVKKIDRLSRQAILVSVSCLCA